MPRARVAWQSGNGTPATNRRAAQAKVAPTKPTLNKTPPPDQKKALRELAEVEASIDKAKKELAVYEKQLADPKIYQNAAQLKDATVKFE